MSRTQRTTLIVTTVVLALLILTIAYLPALVSELSYAIESGRSRAVRERLTEDSADLSQKFRDVVVAIRPSVVSISSTRTVPLRNQLGGGPSGQGGDDGDLLAGEQLVQFRLPRGGFVQRGVGSGVIVSDDGYVLTNAHVVRGASEVTVIPSDDRQLAAEVVGIDPATDLAVLKVDSDNLTPAELGDSDEMAVGEWTLAVGSPMGLDQTVTAGIVSAKGRANVGIADYEDFIQTDAAVNPGNSGGPLVNLRGEVVGINTAIASRTGGNMGIGFAIPSNMAEKIKDSIIEQGSVERGQLGVMVQDLTQDMASSFGYDSTEGVLIGDVVDGGPAERAGLQTGDIVLQYDGEDVNEAHQLRNRVAETTPGTEVEVKIFRDGEEQTVTVTIGRREGQTAAIQPPATAEGDQVGLGIVVATLTHEIADRLGIEGNQQGVVVVRVSPAGAGFEAGIRAGDLIVAVNNSQVTNVSELRDALEQHPPSEGIRLQVVRDGARRFVHIRTEADGT